MHKKLLITGDIVLSIFALYSGFFLRFGSLLKMKDVFGFWGERLFIFVLVLIFSSFFMEIYNYENNSGKKESVARVSLALILSFFVLSSLFYILPFAMFGRGVLALSLGVFGLFQFFWHVNYKKMVLNIPGFARRILILGTGQLAKRIGGIVSSNHYYVLAGYVNCVNEPVYVPPHSIIHNGNGLLETAKREKAHKIVVSLSERRGVFPLKDVLTCKLSGVDVVDAPSFYEEMTGKLLIEDITPSWFIFSDGFKITSFKMSYKRLLDTVLAVFGLIITFPLIPLIALLIKIESQGPVFYKQVRVGKGEKHFVIYKFRTMFKDAELNTGAIWAQEDDSRVTLLGRFLRKTRLDEIPQLYNVLRGDMSLIGPRPERPEFIKKLREFIPYYSERHFVKPGITGWAQVKYPYGASVEDALEKLRYDLYYIKNLTLFLDMLIVLETIKILAFGRGGR